MGKEVKRDLRDIGGQRDQKGGWRERLVKELEELSCRIDKLDSFIKSENFLKLRRTDKLLLELQRGAMENYRHILLLRLANSKSCFSKSSFNRVYFPLNADKE